jgi:hypothetical protein
MRKAKRLGITVEEAASQTRVHAAHGDARQGEGAPVAVGLAGRS